MKETAKYARQYFMPPEMDFSWMKKDHLDKAPDWCSVDLRDGNQSLIIPMSLEEKIEFFQMLVKIGFKEIEVGFPAASETEYAFLRALIEKDLIPSDVTIQVLTQAREHIIRKTFDALSGCKTPAVVHLYNSTSKAQREQVFKKSKEEIVNIAVEGAKLLLTLSKEYPGTFRFEYSPESFTGTEPEFALEICNAVLEVWEPTAENKAIINLPVTVSHSMPHVYACQIAYMNNHIKYRENVIISLHPHNDRGCAVADSEMGLLAGADRIEGTLFGNGERTGNVDIITLALNLYSQGVEPNLDFTDVPAISALYERVTRMKVYERSPYTGALVFAAFSGSHQDAIAKGMKCRENPSQVWDVPYLPIDPKDVGREYETDVIRINSQSGKGGIGYLLEQNYGYDLPPKMREHFGYAVKDVSDRQHKELSPKDVLEVFQSAYINLSSPIEFVDVVYKQVGRNVEAAVEIKREGVDIHTLGNGNGRLDGVSNALKEGLKLDYTIVTYKEHALTQSSQSQAAAYVGIQDAKGTMFWGTGTDNDIMLASVLALVSAVNNMLKG